MKIEYDQMTDTLTIQFSERPVQETRSINDVLMVDLDENGHPVYIEVLSASHYGDISEITYKLLTEPILDGNQE